MNTGHTLHSQLRAPVSSFMNAVIDLIAHPPEGDEVANLLPHLVHGQFDLLIARHPARIPHTIQTPSLNDMQTRTPAHFEALRYAAYLHASSNRMLSPAEFLRLWPTLRPEQHDRAGMLPGFHWSTLATCCFVPDGRYPVSQWELPYWLIHEWRELPCPNVSNLDHDSPATPYDWSAKDFRQIVRSLRLSYAAGFDSYLTECVHQVLHDPASQALTNADVQIRLAQMETDANAYLLGMGTGSELFWYLAWSGTAYFHRMFRWMCHYAAFAAVHNETSPLRLFYGFADFIYPAIYEHARERIEYLHRDDAHAA